MRAVYNSIMRRIVILLALLFVLGNLAFANDFKSLDALNSTNLAEYFNDYIGYPYDSHGCLHFTPSNIYLLAKTIPVGAPLTIMPYGESVDLKNIPSLVKLTKSEKDIKLIKDSKIVVYPSQNVLIIFSGDKPYAKMDALVGPAEAFMLPGDIMLTTPTDPGEYKIFRITDHYISSAYYKNTIIPFGAWIVKNKEGNWIYEKKEKWYKAPQNVVKDISLPLEKQQYNYFDVSANAMRYAGHDFGKYVILWTTDGKSHYPEMGYAAGELLFEQTILIKDLVHLLTIPDSDNLDDLVVKNKNFSFYKSLNELVKSKGKKVPIGLSKEVLASYRLYKGFSLSKEDYKYINPKALKAFREYSENRLPRNPEQRSRALGYYYYLRQNAMVIEKEAYWYEKLNKDWEFWKNLKVSLKDDFKKMGILSLENRQTVLDDWLNDRLEFKTVFPSKHAKNVGAQTFSSQFNQKDQQALLFSKREREIMKGLVGRALSGEVIPELKIYSVDALNNYNYGVLLNDILGDLYKSHGCMHVSPRNIYLLYNMLPLKTQMTVYDYSKKIDEKDLKAIPDLAGLVNFEGDMHKLTDVKIAVYPQSGWWIIYVSGKPYAKLQVKGGPKEKYYLVQGRDAKGYPIFEKHLAYPTTPGNYYIFKKVENYLSNIYYNTTIVPMGVEIKRGTKNWVFKDKKGNERKLPSEIEQDLLSKEGSKYNYYDVVKNSSDEVVSVRWGSHPFGRYSIQTTLDYKSPSPELIHSSGDLMMEERQLISDLIKVLSAPYDDLDKCVSYSKNFDLYKTCSDFVNNPQSNGIQLLERANYKLYYGLKLLPEELNALPKDTIIADKIRRNQKLNKDELELLITEGIAYRRGRNIKIDSEKILGLNFDNYQYVVMIEKYAHHYEVLKKHWGELGKIRQALLKDFNNFAIKDSELLSQFLRDLMLRRTGLKRLSNKEALEILHDLLK